MNRLMLLLFGLSFATTASCRVKTEGLSGDVALAAYDGARADAGDASRAIDEMGISSGSGGSGENTTAVTGTGGAGGRQIEGGAGGWQSPGTADAGAETNDVGTMQGSGGSPGSGGSVPVVGTGGVKGSGGTGGAQSTGGAPGVGGATAPTGTGGVLGAGGNSAVDAPPDLPTLPRWDGAIDVSSDSATDTAPDIADVPAANDSRDAPATVDMENMPVDTRPRANLLWSDEFNGAANSSLDPANWTYVLADPGYVNGEAQKYTDRIENAFVDGNGNLVIRALNVPYQSFTYTSARITTQGRGSFGPGVRIEVRAKLPAGRGSFPGILAIGGGTWPYTGALALAEQYGQDKSWVYATAYAPSDPQGDTGHIRYNFSNATTASADYHIYSVDWYADHLVFQIDGNTVISKTFNGSPFDSSPEAITLDVALGGSMGLAIDDSAFPMDMTVDYVRVYSL